MSESRLGEIALIAQYLAPLATHPGAFGLRDDAALLTNLPAQGLVITADACVAGVHFFEDDDPGDAAYKSLATNVSDLAAKAARPIGYSLSLALAEAPSCDWAARFTAGLARAQERFGITLLGGDTVTARGAWWLSITAFGEASAHGMVPRGGAKPGDLVYVSGTLGDAALGLQLRLGKAEFEAYLSPDERDFLLKRYLYPEPRLALSEALAVHASAAMDLSDGLALDLTRMCLASDLTAKITIPSLPLSKAAHAALHNSAASLSAILAGGDDYEILAAIPADRAASFETASATAGVLIARIGSFLPGAAKPAFMTSDGTEFFVDAPGFEHFNR